MQIRRAGERGHGAHGWLDSWHTFSFAGYFDPRQMGFGPLRVINDDTVAPRMGFGEHPHTDMEILSYVLEGALRHRDSAGHESVLGPGSAQRISAGRGIRHSEFNASASDPVHFYQIWIEPRERGVEPAYGELPGLVQGERGRWTLASPDGRDGSLAIHQDAVVAVQRLAAGDEVVWEPSLGTRQWLQVTRGRMTVADAPLAAGDGAAWPVATARRLTAASPAEALLFELP